MTATGTIEVKGLDALVRKLKADALYGKEWREGFRQLLGRERGAVQATAPRNTGRLSARIVSKMHAAPVPLWGMITTTGGVRYGFILNAGHGGTKVFHYRSGRHQGQPTKGWFSWIWRGARAGVEKMLADLSGRIERNFGRGI